MLRFLVIIQGTALAYFVFAAAKFPHDLPSYTVGMLYFGTIFISLLPLILGFSYFLFDFRRIQKLGLTVGTMAYLALFLPFPYMLHVWIIHKSVLIYAGSVLRVRPISRCSGLRKPLFVGNELEGA